MKKLFILITLFIISPPSDAQVAVIANNSVPVESIDAGDLLDLYSKEIKYWSNGEPVILFDLKPRNNVKDAFYSFLGKSSSRMKSIWMKKKLSGEGNPPVALETEEQVLRRIAVTPGAIGYISRALVESADIKIIAVIEIPESTAGNNTKEQNSIF